MSLIEGEDTFKDFNESEKDRLYRRIRKVALNGIGLQV